MQWIYEPWAMAIAVGIGAFLLGLLISKKSGTNWISAVVFFLPNLFLDVLDMVHTKKFKYYGLILALLSIEAFFAFRAATVYYDVLHERMPGPEMAIVCVIIFIAVFLCGYMVATHGKWTFWSVCTMIFVIIHDWAGTIWMNYSQPATATASATIAAPDDPLKVILTIGMCVLGLLPFIMGAWAEELRPELEAEMEEEVNAFTNMATRKIKRRAVDRVLRMANHTNVVHLVRALPADEFADFKKFVMPIIAPGMSHNLPDLEEQSDNLTDKMTDASLPIATQETGQDGDLTPGQNDEPSPDKVAGSQPAKRQSSTRQNGDQEPASKTAIRDEKIRQYAAKYPKMTYAKLAAKFKVSERTIARALTSQITATSEPQAPSALLENGEAKPSTNGHHKNQEPNTDEMEVVVISENDADAVAQLN